jgi:hypothetical protein
MARPHDKFLVSLLSGVSSKQVFFAVWAAISAVFVMLMMSFYKKNTRRNFRDPGDRGPRIDVDLRKLGEGNTGKHVVSRDNTPKKG